jgi:2-polyprenyl-3-methyl-5-hydroxy-6-metoxy-1,4-benzoquinol methylase
MASNFRWQIAQQAERKWWKNYLKNKNVAEYIAWKKNYWQTIIEHCQPHINIQPTDTILDAGCGPAGIFIVFNDNAVTAFDSLLDTYEKDLPHFKKSNYPQVQFVNAGIENFSSTTQYDTIFCLNAINHVQDINKGYDVLCQYLKPGGTMVVSIDAHNYNIFKTIFKLLPGDVLHPHQYNLAEYNKFITTRGLQLLNTKNIKHEFFFDHYIQIAKKPLV